MFSLATYYRMVGGVVGTGSTILARLRFALTMALYMAFLCCTHHDDMLTLLVVLAGCFVTTFAGRLIPHSKFEGMASIGNSIAMTVINAVRLGLIVAPYLFAELFTQGQFHLLRVLPVAFAVFSGIGYYAGWKWLNGKDMGLYWRDSHTQYQISVPPAPMPVAVGDTTRLNECAVGGSEWGEVITGLGYQLFFVALLVLA